MGNKKHHVSSFNFKAFIEKNKMNLMILGGFVVIGLVIYGVSYVI
jgi:hypothetical protein